jgi:hypothetical protein
MVFRMRQDTSTIAKAGWQAKQRMEQATLDSRPKAR